jgi:cytidylate kinase
MALGHVDLPTATRALRHADRAHAEYVRRFYDVEIDDPALYHLVIDTTAFDLATCVDLVTRAASGLATASR